MFVSHSHYKLVGEVLAGTALGEDSGPLEHGHFEDHKEQLVAAVVDASLRNVCEVPGRALVGGAMSAFVRVL